ncbi:hypothetical protein CYY_001517 [Polysphondylium violaceum]|uniref:Swiss Army Knife RNA repair protein HAD domain-containing protein n=1 Tax=Polysphondylium violaceum TaxID=133409 RepID=A0A8J4Q012_9MYCE|nr:hypothetical protein CYY_001517 [Polysphondylium violaceum]
MNLYIYDFDGTLFKSPEPNPSLWHTSLLGKINGMPQENGLGWFQETMTLDEPYVPSNPSREEWFNENVLSDALKHIQDENNIVCLLTGRTELYRDIINRILKSVNLNFHHVGLKPINIPNVARESTMDFKKKFILNLLNEEYKNKIKTVTIYEDRPKHVEAFTKFLEGLKQLSKFHIEYIQDGSKYLAHDLETDLINYLIEKNGQGMIRKKFVDYTCSRLDKESQKKLLDMFSLPKEWLIKTHHVTMNQGVYNPKQWLAQDGVEQDLEKQFALLSTTTTSTTSTSTVSNTAESTTITTSSSVVTATATTTTLSSLDSLKEEYPIGKWLDLQVEAVGISANAVAVKVKGCPTCNIIPHCTIAIHPLAKAVDSNKIRKWFSVDQFEKGKTITLSSHDEEELKAYKEMMDKPQQSPKSPSQQLPPVSITFTRPLDSQGLKIRGVIEEIGKVGIEIDKKAVQAAKAATGDPNKWNIFPMLQKLYPKLGNKELQTETINVKQWVKTNKVEDIKVLQDYLSKLNL